MGCFVVFSVIEWVKKKPALVLASICLSSLPFRVLTSPVLPVDSQLGAGDVGLRGRGLCEAQRKVGVLAATPPFPSVGLGAGL